MTVKTPKVKPARHIKMGATQLKTSEQQKNYAESLVALITSGQAEDQARRVMAAKFQALYKDVLKKHSDDRREWLGYLKADGSINMPTSADGFERYRDLTQRYGIPTESDVHIDMLATDYLIDNPQGEFVAPLAMPFWRVSKRTGLIQSLDRRAGKNASFDDTRGIGLPAKSMGFSLGSQVSYATVARGFKIPVPDEITMVEDDPIKVAELAARYIRETIFLRHEKRVAAILQSSANYPSDNQITTPSVKWDNVDRTDNEHKDDLDNGMEKVLKAIGVRPNTAIMTFPVAQALIRKEDFTKRLQYVDRTMDDTLMNAIAAYIGVGQVLIPTCTEDTADLSATATYSYVWDDDVVLLHVSPPSIGSVNFGVCPTVDMGTAINYRDPDPTSKTDVTAVLFDTDEVICNSAAGAHLADVLT